MSVDSLTPLQQELLRRADSIMSSIGSTASAAGQFVAEQVPDVALQYVAYGRAYSTLFVAFGLLGACVSLYVIITYGMLNKAKIPNRVGSYIDEWGSTRTTVVFIGTIVTVVFLFIAAVNAKELLMVWFAPKVWLLQELTGLIKRIKS